MGGPVIEWVNGRREWWLKGELHREDSPAIIKADGAKEWWLFGLQFKEESYYKFITYAGKNSELPYEMLKTISEEWSEDL